MRFDILTLFPEMFTSPFSQSMFRKAMERGLVKIVLHNIRDYTRDKHRTVDDYPYGGGAGMILKPAPIFEAVEAIKAEINCQELPVILLSPQGRLFHHGIAQELAQQKNIILICGRYEGVDERVAEHLATDEISIGDYVLSGGELVAMVMVEAVVRLLPGVLGSEISPTNDSHTAGLLEYPQYTRPRVYRDWAVPDILISGNHQEIAKWRRQQALLRTLKRRPDLLAKAPLTDAERNFLEKGL